MPRHARIDPPVLHHVMIRGVVRREVFGGDKDGGFFRDRLGGISQGRITPCHAWTLLKPHSFFIERREDLGMWRSLFGFCHSPVCGQQLRHNPSFGKSKQKLFDLNCDGPPKGMRPI